MAWGVGPNVATPTGRCAMFLVVVLPRSSTQRRTHMLPSFNTTAARPANPTHCIGHSGKLAGRVARQHGRSGLTLGMVWLQSSLRGTGSLMLLAHVSAEPADLAESLSTLRFADRAGQMRRQVRLAVPTYMTLLWSHTVSGLVWRAWLLAVPQCTWSPSW